MTAGRGNSKLRDFIYTEEAGGLLKNSELPEAMWQQNVDLKWINTVLY